MDIRICPNCGILFDMDKRIWELSWDNIECKCCKQMNPIESYIKYE